MFNSFYRSITVPNWNKTYLKALSPSKLFLLSILSLTLSLRSLLMYYVVARCFFQSFDYVPFSVYGTVSFPEMFDGRRTTITQCFGGYKKHFLRFESLVSLSKVFICEIENVDLQHLRHKSGFLCINSKTVLGSISTNNLWWK